MTIRVETVNRANGWFDSDRTVGDEIALLHSELSEALEEFREGRMVTEFEENGKPIGLPSEMADVLIRVLDFCHRYGIDLWEEYDRKMAYNMTRAYRHGGRAI